MIVKFPDLSAEMARCGENQATLAELLDLPISAISRRMNGKIEFTKKEIDIICKHYSKTYEQLFKESK